MQLNHLNLRVRDARACRDFYVRHFGFEPAFEAEGGFFLRNAHGFLLAVVPIDPHTPLPEGFHIGFGVDTAEAVFDLHGRLSRGDVTVGEVEDHRPGERYVTFRCWDPDATEIEVFWESA